MLAGRKRDVAEGDREAELAQVRQGAALPSGPSAPVLRRTSLASAAGTSPVAGRLVASPTLREGAASRRAARALARRCRHRWVARRTTSRKDAPAADKPLLHVITYPGSATTRRDD